MDPTGDNRRPAARISRRRFLLCGGSAAGALVLGRGLLWEPRRFEVRQVALPMAKIPPGREMRLVHLSDLHIREFNAYLEGVAAAVGRLAPEIILLTGDFLQRSRNLAGVKQFLERLKAPLGIFAVQGNYEYWARIEGENLRRKFAGSGVRLLINERRDLDFLGVPLSVLGLDYPSAADDIRRLQGLADPDRINLMLSHVPAFDHDLLDGWVDAIFCGHTHGGQVRLPFLPPFYLPRFSAPYVEGLYRVGPQQTPLYITRGIGTSILPVRFLCRPEITLVRLHATGQDQAPKPEH